MKSKWSVGIEPRGFTWVYRGRLAVAERPGGSTAVHRRVRRDEELLWLQHQGFTRIISLLPMWPSAAAYEAHGMTSVHYGLRAGSSQRDVLAACYRDLAASGTSGQVTLLHGDDVSDRILGVVAGYLVWSGTVAVPPAIALIERLFRRSLGPEGRAMLSDLPEAP